MGFILGSIWISIVGFVIALVVVRPLFALIFPRRQPPSLYEVFKVTAGWVCVSFLPALAYTMIFQGFFGDMLKEVVAARFPNAPPYTEPFAAFGVIYTATATAWALLILAHDHKERKA